MITKKEARELFKETYQEEIAAAEEFLDKKIKESIKEGLSEFILRFENRYDEAVYKYVAQEHKYIFYVDITAKIMMGGPTQATISGWI